MTTVTFGDGGGAAYDGTVVIVVSPSPKARELLQWSIRQYKGRSSQPSLASGNKSFARDQQAGPPAERSDPVAQRR